MSWNEFLFVDWAAAIILISFHKSNQNQWFFLSLFQFHQYYPYCYNTSFSFTNKKEEKQFNSIEEWNWSGLVVFFWAASSIEFKEFILRNNWLWISLSALTATNLPSISINLSLFSNQLLFFCLATQLKGNGRDWFIEWWLGAKHITNHPAIQTLAFDGGSSNHKSKNQSFHFPKEKWKD